MTLINTVDVKLIIIAMDLLKHECDEHPGVCYLNRKCCDKECEKLAKRFVR